VIGLAVVHELRTLLRSRSSVAAVVAFLACGLYAIFAGQSFTAGWQASLDEVEERRSEAVEEARSHLSAGRFTPPDRTWIDLRFPAWQDVFSQSFVARRPGALSGVAFGAVDNSPVVVSINRTTDPFLAEGVHIENPEHGSSGDLDLAFVLVYLLPLLVAVLGIEIGGYERDRGLVPLLAVQTGRPWRWFMTRVAVVTGLSGVAAFVLCTVAALVAGAGPAGFGPWLELSGIALVYTLVWGAVLAVVLSFRGGVSANALGMGLAWVLICILGPTLAAEVALSRTADDYGLDLSLEARAERYDMAGLGQTGLRNELYRTYPRLRDLPYTNAPQPNRQNERHAMEGMMFAALRERHEARAAREAQQLATLATSLWFSPAIATSHALERLAGVGHEAATSFRARVVEATGERVDWVLESAWTGRLLDLGDFDALIESSSAEELHRAESSRVHLAVLALWVVGLLAFAGVRMRAGIGR
jgi:ABC-type transport system involved in multi-copper enzyme maturation permease subunit